MPESDIAWTRVIVVFLVIFLSIAALVEFAVHARFAQADVPAISSDRQSLTEIQKHLNVIEKRLEDLESRRRTSSRTAADMKEPEEFVQNQSSAPRHPRTQYQVSPHSAIATPAVAAPPAAPDAASAKQLASLQEGIGALQDEANSNKEAWQATTNRLAEVAGELGTQHGQIIQNKDELNRFLGRTEHTSLTFELRRGSDPEPVGPVRIALKSSNQKSQRYTLCVYLQNSCLRVKDRAQYEVVQLAVSRDTAPLELIATKVERNGIVGYLEVPREKPAR
jgi:septal ring factor EnvC (AmiA/AmiB activator)